MEMVCAIVHQLTRGLTQEQIRSGGFSTYFINHTTGNFPCDANGMPFSAATLQVTGNPITDVHEDLAAEQKVWTKPSRFKAPVARSSFILFRRAFSARTRSVISVKNRAAYFSPESPTGTPLIWNHLTALRHRQLHFAIFIGTPSSAIRRTPRRRVQLPQTSGPPKPRRHWMARHSGKP